MRRLMLFHPPTRAAAAFVASALLVLSVATFVSPASAQTVGLVAEWTGNGNTLDTSGNNHHGTGYGGQTFENLPGGGQGFKFNGTTAGINVFDHPDFQITGSLTISALIRIDALTPASNQHMQILFRGDQRGGFDPYFLAVDPTSGRLQFRISDAANNQVQVFSANPLPLGQFLNVAGTLDNATGKLSVLINNALVGEVTTSVRPFAVLDAAQNPGVGIGNHPRINPSPFVQPFNGVIANVRLFNTVAAVAAPEPTSLTLLALTGLSVVGAVIRRNPVSLRRRRAA